MSVNPSPKIAQPKAEGYLKPVCSHAALARVLQQAVPDRHQGTAEYALQEFYFGVEGILTIDHASQTITKEKTA